MKLHMAIVIAAFSTTLAVPAYAEPTERTVIIHVTSPEGEDLEGVPLLISNGTNGHFEMTDDSGGVTVTLTFEENNDNVGVKLSTGVGYPVKQDYLDQAKDKYEFYSSSYSFKHQYLFDAPPDAQEIQCDIEPDTAVCASGKLVTATNDPYDNNAHVNVSMRNSSTFLSADDNGSFTVCGYPQSQPGYLLFSIDTGSHATAYWRHVDGQQSINDFDVGSVVVSTPDFNSTLDMTLSADSEVVSPNSLILNRTVSLIHASPQSKRIISYNVDSATGGLYPFFSHSHGEEPVSAPSGTYWIVLGAPGFSPVMNVLDLVRTGNTDPLTNAGVPKIELTADETTELNLNADDLYQAIQQALSQ